MSKSSSNNLRKEDCTSPCNTGRSEDDASEVGLYPFPDPDAEPYDDDDDDDADGEDDIVYMDMVFWLLLCDPGPDLDPAIPVLPFSCPFPIPIPFDFMFV